MLALTIICAALFLTSVVLVIKVHQMHISLEEIRTGISERLDNETNTLISISCGDRYVRRLASDINGQLRRLRNSRHRYESGDQELRDAVTNMSHDIRTPLTAICGYLDLLERAELDDTAKRYVAIIRNRTDVLKHLADELFSYSIVASAKAPEEFEDISINDVLEESFAGYYAALTENGIEPQIQIPKRDIRCLSDKASLTRIFGNVISNAVKYSHGDLRAILTEDGMVTFSNRAPGLDTVMAGRLFDRFYTVETGRDSTGLGLSIAKLLTERLGGKIYSEFNEGVLSIVIKLPVK